MLKKITLKDFKSFADESAELGKLCVLVGANASGKSNLLDALRFLQGLALDMSVGDILRGRWEGGRQVWPGVRGGLAEAARIGSRHFSIETTWRMSGPRPAPGATSIRLGRRTIWHSVGVDTGKDPAVAKEGLWSSDVDGYLFDTHARALRDRSGRSGGNLNVALKRTGKGNSPTQTHNSSRSLLKQLDTSKPVAPAVAVTRDRLVEALRSAYFLDITPSLMRDYAPKHISDLGLEGENVSALTWQLCQDANTKQDLVDWLTELCAPELADIDFAETDLGDVMLVLVEHGGRRIPARSLSDGTLRFLGELIALRTAPEGSLLLIEEIENGLHPTRTHLLVEAMEAAVTERNVQVVATTHSPLVLNALSADTLRQAVLVARPPGSEGSLLRRLGDLPGFDGVVERRGVDRMLASGWLERAV